MTVTALLSELQALGVHVEAHGDRLRFWPRSAVAGELLARLAAHKAELLDLLPPAAPEPDSLFPPDLLAALGAATVRWADPTGSSIDAVDDGARDSAAGIASPGDTNRQPAARGFRRLVGNGFPGRPTETPDPRILVDPLVMCPCGVARALPELRAMTNGLCWQCRTTERPGP
jgi:hypothetical protein